MRDSASLEAWLTERYCYFNVSSRGAVYRCDIEHPRWRLAQAEAEIQCNTLGCAFGLQLPATPPAQLQMADDLTAHIWPLRRVP